MPIRVDMSKPLSVHKRVKSKLFRDTEKKSVENINGNNLILDSHFNSLQKFAFKLLDKFESIIRKHPKFGEKLMGLTEKLIKNAEELK